MTDLVSAARRVVELIAEDADIEDELADAGKSLEEAIEDFASARNHLEDAIGSVEDAIGEVRDTFGPSEEDQPRTPIGVIDPEAEDTSTLPAWPDEEGS